MTTAKTHRIEFTETTAFGDKKRSTVWMSLEECKSSKWINSMGAKIISR